MMENSKESAFPTSNSDRGIDRGLTKREYFAAMAMQGILSNSGLIYGDNLETISNKATLCADKLLKQLES